MFKLSFLSFLLTLFVLGCESRKSKVQPRALQSFDVSSDGKLIIFTIANGEKIDLFVSGIDGGNPRLLSDSNNQKSIYNPRFSTDGEKIVYLERRCGAFNSSIWISNFNGDFPRQISDTNGIKTEAIFSKNGKEIYFAQAKEYESYSTLVNPAAHNFNLYSIEINSGNISKLTNFNVYSLSSISQINSNKLLLSITDEISGIFFYNKEKSTLNRIAIKDDTLSYSKGYSKPIMINDSTIICASHYVLVKINISKQTEKVIIPSNKGSFQVVRYNKTLDRVFYQRSTDLDVIHSVNLDGTDIKDIPLLFK